LAKNPALHLPNVFFVRIVRLPLAPEDFEHSKEPKGCVERIISIWESLLHAVRQFRIEFEVRLSCPSEQARSGSVPGYDDGEGLKLAFPLAQSAFSPLLSAAWLKIAVGIAPAAAIRSSLTLWV